MVHVDDEYARKHMAGEGEVLYFDRRDAPTSFRLLMSIGPFAAVGGALAAAIANGNPLTMLGAVPIVALAGVGSLMFWALRTVVTRQFLHIQYGLFGPKVPISDVVSAEVVHYDWKKYGGFGIRYALDGSTAYNMMGDQGTAVKIIYKSGAKQKTLLVSAQSAEKLVAAIQQAQSGSALADGLAEARADLGVLDAPAVAEEVVAVREEVAATKSG